jgi:ABC-type branched-subunit amino acid transport system ATPase component
LNHLYCNTYDDSKTVEHLIKSIEKPFNGESEEKNNFIFSQALFFFKIPKNEKISNLLESQKKTFEIIFSLASLQTTDGPFLIVLDEYLDKENIEIRKKITTNLRHLCNLKQINLQVILITHSKSTYLQCSDRTIVLHHGRVFDQGEPSRVSLPFQSSFLL